MVNRLALTMTKTNFESSQSLAGLRSMPLEDSCIKITINQLENETQFF